MKKNNNNLNKLQRLNRKMLKAWAKKKSEKAAKIRQKIIKKSLKNKKND